MYLVLRGGRTRAHAVVETLLARGARAEVWLKPTLMIETTADPRQFEKAWNDTR